MRTALALGLCLMLSGCATPAPAPHEPSPDELAAIQHGKELCEWTKPRTPYDRWFASFHDGLWSVWNVLGRRDAIGDPTIPGELSDAHQYARIDLTGRTAPGGCFFILR